MGWFKRKKKESVEEFLNEGECFAANEWLHRTFVSDLERINKEHEQFVYYLKNRKSEAESLEDFLDRREMESQQAISESLDKHFRRHGVIYPSSLFDTQQHTIKQNTMTRQDYITAIRNREYLIVSDNIPDLMVILRECFPEDVSPFPHGSLTSGIYFSACRSDKNKWTVVNSISDFRTMKSINASTLANMKDELLSFKILPEQAQRIINIACNTWKTNLAALWSKDIVLNQTIEISQSFYQEMRSACTEQQHKLFDEIFGPDVPEFKAGDFVVTGNYPLKALVIEEWNSDIKVFKNPLDESTYHYGKTLGTTIRHATPEEIRAAQYPPDGTPCWVRDGAEPWSLRYADGTGKFYMQQRKSGESIPYNHVKLFDPSNLPFND